MNAFLTFIQGDPAVVVLPALGFAISLAMVRFKRRYVGGDAKADREASREWVFIVGRREATYNRNWSAGDEITDELAAVLSLLHGLRDRLLSLAKDSELESSIAIFLNLRTRLDRVKARWYALMQAVDRENDPAEWDAAQVDYAVAQEAVLHLLDEVAVRDDKRIDADVSAAVQAIENLEARVKSLAFGRLL
ncbi:hypothetical protein [Paraburkholderia sp. J10-1]|uniref:hypothetical protein n=1 Tax=Paraburkholderia sp. J10-1 TaxID=2805430 RepID=UPI002AB657F6|nr:hypothetical protein [Paraburkholderia sp. J10-1]